MADSPHREEGTVGFSLDTSGSVLVPSEHYVDEDLPITWSDLSPFQQGYTAAMFAELVAPMPKPLALVPRFSDLHPSALERIIGDCERYEDGARAAGLWSRNAYHGALLWKVRQCGTFPRFPPQRVSLSDAGQVELEDA